MPKKRSIKAPVRIRTNKANIKVVGIGGGGGNAISRMKESFAIRGVEFIALNTDVQDLDFCNASKKLAIGKNVTRGLGTGMDPGLGRQAAEESRTEIANVLSGADLVFVTAGLGGGTGSGASSIVAEIAKELGALTVAVVTKPFSFEGGQRSKIADEALERLKAKVDTYIAIPNDRIFSIISKDTSINKAFERIDDILRGAVQGIAELIAMAGLINVDFADVKAIMQNAGPALVGIGVGTGKERGISAVRQVLNSPLLDIAIDGARGILFGISGGRDLKMMEINDIAKMITENADPAARVIFGAYYSRKVEKGGIKITLIATNFGAEGLSTQQSLSRDEDHNKFEFKANPLFPDMGIESETNRNNNEEIVHGTAVRRTSDTAMAKGEKLGQSMSIDKPKKTTKKSTEIWDIPAFLRRGKDKK